jgi:hypothetical protein
VRLYFHCSRPGFSNCYVLGTDFAGDDELPLGAAPPREAALPLEAMIRLKTALFLSLIHDTAKKGVGASVQ